MIRNKLKVNQYHLHPKFIVCVLHCTFDDCLSLDACISNICRSTHFHVRNIGRNRNLLTFITTAQLFHALITVRLDFCNSIHYNLPKYPYHITEYPQNKNSTEQNIVAVD